MIFKERKIPRHLIIEDEWEVRKRSKFGVFKLFFWSLLLVSLTYAVLQVPM